MVNCSTTCVSAPERFTSLTAREGIGGGQHGIILTALWASPFRPSKLSMCSVWGTWCACMYLVYACTSHELLRTVKATYMHINCTFYMVNCKFLMNQWWYEDWVCNNDNNISQYCHLLSWQLINRSHTHVNKPFVPINAAKCGTEDVAWELSLGRHYYTGHGLTGSMKQQSLSVLLYNEN